MYSERFAYELYTGRTQNPRCPFLFFRVLQLSLCRLQAPSVPAEKSETSGFSSPNHGRGLVFLPCPCLTIKCPGFPWHTVYPPGAFFIDDASGVCSVPLMRLPALRTPGTGLPVLPCLLFISLPNPLDLSLPRRPGPRGCPLCVPVAVPVPLCSCPLSSSPWVCPLPGLGAHAASLPQLFVVFLHRGGCFR